MDCRNVEPFLSAWADGQLSEAQAKVVRDHVSQCPGCWGELQALESVSSRLDALMKGLRPEEAAAPAGLMSGLRALPSWLVWLAVVRRGLMAAGGTAAAGVALILILRWSAPLPATMTLAATGAAQPVAAGATLVAAAGETAQMRLAAGHGIVTLHGPGALIVRQAAVGRVRGDERLELDMPSGQATVRFLARAPAHVVRLATPQARVSMTGTWVIVQADSLTTTVYVLEGAATVQSLADGRRLTLPLGQMAQVQGGQIHVAMIPMDEWLSRKGMGQDPYAVEVANPAPAFRQAPLFHEPANTPKETP